MAIILGILLLCSFVVVGTIYRKWKIEMEIEGLLWKIELNDLIGYYGNDVVSSTKVSIQTRFFRFVGTRIFEVAISPRVGQHYFGGVLRIA